MCWVKADEPATNADSTQAHARSRSTAFLHDLTVPTHYADAFNTLKP